jgi:hypothetical protein
MSASALPGTAKGGWATTSVPVIDAPIPAWVAAVPSGSGLIVVASVPASSIPAWATDVFKAVANSVVTIIAAMRAFICSFVGDTALTKKGLLARIQFVFTDYPLPPNAILVVDGRMLPIGG